MGYFAAAALGLLVGGGLYFGLATLGRELRIGMVEAAKVKMGEPIGPPAEAE